MLGASESERYGSPLSLGEVDRRCGSPARLVEMVCRKSSRNGTGKDADAPQMYREQAVTSAAAVDRPSLGDLDSAHCHINLLAGISDLTFPFARTLPRRPSCVKPQFQRPPLDGIEARFGRSAGLSGLFLPANQPRC